MRRGVGQEHAQLAVLHPPGRARVLPLHPRRPGSLLDEPGLVDDQHAAGVAQVPHHVAAHVVADPVRVPGRRVQQPLHPVRRRVPGRLGQRPAVLAASGASSPRTYARARSRGSTRGNRPATSANKSSSPATHAARSASSSTQPATPEQSITKYCCSTRQSRSWSQRRHRGYRPRSGGRPRRHSCRFAHAYVRLVMSVISV